MYVYTPYVDQSMYPLFDTAPKDFNFESIFTENAFSGVDRVSDGNQLTAGVTTPHDRSGQRRRGAAPGGRAARALCRPARHARRAGRSRGASPTCCCSARRRWCRSWTLDGSVQYNPDQRELARSSSAHATRRGRFAPCNADLPRRPRDRRANRSSSAGSGRSSARRRSSATPGAGARRVRRRRRVAQGSLYTVGRVNYSMKDSRVTDGVLGFEYDAGCWIGRIVVERLSTGVERGDDAADAAARAGRPVAPRFQPAAGLEGQYPGLPAAARHQARRQRPCSSYD